jgi:hypothetical protein
VVAVGRTSVSGWVAAPFVLVPSGGVFGRLDLAALRGCHTLNVCFFWHLWASCLDLSMAIRCAVTPQASDFLIRAIMYTYRDPS